MHLTKLRYLAILSQELHLYGAAPEALRQAAAAMPDDPTGEWLKRRAADAAAHHAWAESFLKDAQQPAARPSLATQHLIEQLRRTAIGPRPWEVLAFCSVIDGGAPSPSDLSACSGEDLADTVMRNQFQGPPNGRELPTLIHALDEGRRRHVQDAAVVFANLFVRFLLSADPPMRASRRAVA